jgi:hypothetical protein
VEPFAEVLREGGHRNSLGRSAEVLDCVAADPARMPELWACVFDDDAWVRMRAIDTFEKLVRDDPTRGAPYAASLLDDLTTSEQPSIQWHLAQLVPLLDLDDDQLARAVAWLVDRVSTTDVDWIVAANAVKTLVELHGRGVVETDVLRPLLETQTEHRSASVRRKAAAALAALPPGGIG